MLLFSFGEKLLILKLLDIPFNYDYYIKVFPWGVILTLNALFFSFFITLLFIALKKIKKR
jgi:hypothetical protein